MVGFKADAPDEVVWAGLGKVLGAGGREGLSQARVAPILVPVGGVDDAVTVSFPAILIETGDGSTKGFLCGRVGSGADAELSFGVSEEGGLLRHHNLLGAVVCETIAVDVARVPLREDGRGMPEKMEVVPEFRGFGM